MNDDNFPRSEWAQRLRDQAEELQDRAEQARTPEVRLNYLELARSWQKTAERVEERAPETDEERDQASEAPRAQPTTLTP
jgi:hypothetical protein